MDTSYKINLKKLDTKNFFVKLIFLFLSFFILLTIFNNDLIGILSLLLVFLFFFILSIIYNSFAPILLSAILIRIFVIHLGAAYNLPDSSPDALFVELQAYEWSKNGFFGAIKHFPGPRFNFISWLIAIPYSLFGRSLLLAQSMSLFFGMSSIFLSCILLKKISGLQTAKIIGWILALFPSLVLYSVLTLREVYAVFFLLIALFGILHWTNNGNLKSILLTMFGFIGATFFHGALIVGGIFFIFLVFLSNFKILIKNIFINKTVNIKKFIFLFGVLIIFYIFPPTSIYVPKLQYLGNLDFNLILSVSSMKVIGEAAYPNWLIMDSISELFYKGPIRMIYFLFSPFPWDISKSEHIIGLIDGLFYMFISYFVITNIKEIWRNRFLRIIFFILIFYVFIFGIGVGNFGTNVRHRSKFIILLLVLIAPYIQIFKKKLKLTFLNQHR